MTKTKRLTEIAVCVALAVVCRFLVIWRMPQGGSVSPEMVPILFIAYKRGTLTGVVTGVLYGILAMITDGVIYHPASILLDYLLAYGLLGIAGMFGKGAKGLVAGSVAGVAGRFISSVVSGAVLFAEYAPEGQNPWIYSLGYQATYMVPELIISVVILLLLWKKAHRLFEM